MMRRSNSEFVFQGLICVALSALFVYALISGRASDYVHPRLFVFLWFTAGALLFIGAVMLRFSLIPKHNAQPFKNIILIIPMIAAVMIPVGSVQSQAISFGNSTGNPQNNSASAQDKGVVIPDTMSVEDDTGVDAPSAMVPQEDKNGVITVSDEQFADWYQDITDNMEKYKGKTVKMKGQVFRMNNFAKNEFVPVRYAMVCCAADLQPCGILCRSDNAAHYKSNEWLCVTGVIKIEKYMNQTMPICYVTKIEEAVKAQEDYIYFTY